MRYFICALDNVNMGIPAEWAERIISVFRTQTAVYETENNETFIEAFISLPVLFQKKDKQYETPHGVVLKSPATTEDKTKASIKTILLVPRIDRDLEIPEENIHKLPEALAGLFLFFKGACFIGPNLILILSPESIMESIR
ncbi:MAG: hypothetical protein LBH07_08550 [Treponema sp.]|jgi:chemotaxis signal transduction protein|nr:hypothetical protein [Treponema sp.]